jgi:hypothetical protein
VNNSVGDSPGIGVLRVRQGGRAGTLVGIARIDNRDGSIASCAPTGAPASNNRADVHGIAVRIADDDDGARRASVVDQDLERRREEQLHRTGDAPVSCPVQPGATGDECDQTDDPASQVHNH